MKKYVVTKVLDMSVEEDHPASFIDEVVLEGMEDMKVSDGYHTMDELYEHRIELYISLCRCLAAVRENATLKQIFPQVWRSLMHSDGSCFEGWFILGIHKEKGKQITYHLPMSKWVETRFVYTLNRAPEWDGHTPKDVLERLKNL